MEVGRLWQMNRVSVAHEHFCTAATQMIISQLYPRIFSSRRVGRSLVATCISGELHEIGARMVSDFLELEGWDTYYLGANTPTEGIVQMVKERNAHVVAVSATMTYHISAVANLVDAVRSAVGENVKVMVGGYPFRLSDSLWQSVGADGCAEDAQGAVALANELVGG
jgi:methylmalonyl-CoA mutase cobalamin-binding domain/chain